MINGKPLTIGGATGGLKPMIVVTAPTGSTVTCDGITGTEVSGTWTFPTTIGTHTIVASLSGQSKTETVVVDDVGAYPVMIRYSDTHTLFLLQGDSLTDKSMYQRSITNNGVTLSSSATKFQSTSLYFNGTSNILKSLVNITGDCTIEAWINIKSRNNDYPTAMQIMDSTYRGLHGHQRTSLSSCKYWGSGSEITITQNSGLSTNTWHHMAFVRYGSTMKFFINGTLIGSKNLDTQDTLTTIYLGALLSQTTIVSGTYFNGYLDDVRVSDIARYTASFTPPTEAFEP